MVPVTGKRGEQSTCVKTLRTRLKLPPRALHSPLQAKGGLDAHPTQGSTVITDLQPRTENAKEQVPPTANFHRHIQVGRSPKKDCLECSVCLCMYMHTHFLLSRATCLFFPAAFLLRLHPSPVQEKARPILSKPLLFPEFGLLGPLTSCLSPTAINARAHTHTLTSCL